MNDGFINEKVLIDYINSNNFSSYNQNIKDFLTFAFSDFDISNKRISAQKYSLSTGKPDLILSCDNKIKYISVKKGSGNSVHQEKFDMFIDFLKSINISPIAIDNLKLFHYGDDTTDDTGKVRFSAAECKAKYSTQINQLNAEFNQKHILKHMIDRFLLLGNVSNGDTVDVMYHGNLEDGQWVTSEEVTNYLLSNKFRYNAVQFANLTYQVWGRNNNFTAVHPDRRYVMQIKWGNLTKDFNMIGAQRNG